MKSVLESEEVQCVFSSSGGVYNEFAIHKMLDRNRQGYDRELHRHRRHPSAFSYSNNPSSTPRPQQPLPPSLPSIPYPNSSCAPSRPMLSTRTAVTALQPLALRSPMLSLPHGLRSALLRQELRVFNKERQHSNHCTSAVAHRPLLGSRLTRVFQELTVLTPTRLQPRRPSAVTPFARATSGRLVEASWPGMFW